MPEKSGEEEEMRKRRVEAIHERGREGEEDDDGYLTPTSQRQSIPPTAPCPPGPRKKSRQPRRPGRKIHRVVRRRLLFPIVRENRGLLGSPMKTSKKKKASSA